MKRIFIFIFFIFFSVSSFAQLNTWRSQNPPPEPGTLSIVQMINNQVIYACGGNRFVKSNDSGVSWKVQFLPSSFSSMSFLDSNYGMMSGGTSVIKTTDGGGSWMQLNINLSMGITGIVVLDKNSAVAVGMQSISGDGIVIRTTDGGEHWNRVPIPIESMPGLNSIYKLRPDFLSAVGLGGLFLKSLDSGKTWWSYQVGHANDLYKSCFTNDSVGTIIGQFGIMVRTSNGGNTWRTQSLDSDIVTAQLTGIDSKNSHTSAVVGKHGTFVFTADGGANWNRGKALPYTWHDIYDISFCDSMNAVAVGANNMILKTTDGGQTWTYLQNETFIDILYSVAFPKGDTSLGIAVGYEGAIKRTTNGGKKWNDVPTSIVHEIRYVTFADSITAFAVGEYGMILKSTDAGITWGRQNSGTDQLLRAVSFATTNDGIAVGDFNTVLRTYDGGQYWIQSYPIPPQDKEYFCGVSFPDPRHAFIVGSVGVYVSADGGGSWSSTRFEKIIPPDPPNYGQPQISPYKISFSDSLHGAAFLPDHYVIVTSDGGHSWTPTSITGTVFGIYFSDSLRATIVGGYGYISHTIDGGKSWRIQQSNTGSTLYGVCFGTLGAGNAVGKDGTILRITTDEYPLAVHNYSPSTATKKIVTDNYPNPFSTFTTIEYNLPSSGLTAIEIYSVDGKQIATLANEYQTSGDHSIQFNGATFPSGTYICRITINGMTAERQMILLR